MKKLVILGGGTAGWMAANLFAKRWSPAQVAVEVVEDRRRVTDRHVDRLAARGDLHDGLQRLCHRRLRDRIVGVEAFAEARGGAAGEHQRSAVLVVAGAAARQLVHEGDRRCGKRSPADQREAVSLAL